MKPQNIEEYLKLNKFYHKRYLESKKRRDKFGKEFSKSIKSFCKWFNKNFWDMLGLIVSVIIAAFAGMGSEHIIYVLNKPLGLGYANFASYVIAALTFYLLRSKK